MLWLQLLSRTFRAVMRRPQLEREMEAGLAEHLAGETEELMARGVPPAEAHQQAVATMGRTDRIREECRDSRGTAGWEQLKQDISFGSRVLLKNRTFSSMALATMVLGMGSTTAVFSVIDGVLLRPLPFTAPDRLFHADDVGVRGPFDTLRASSRLANYAAHLGVRAFNTTGRDWPERVKGSEVSADFFQVLGASPLLGRTFAEGEDRPGKLRVAWLVVGRTLRDTLVGTLAGLAASWALARWIKTLLYGITEHDLLGFSIPPVVLAAVGFLASLLPMYRAVRIDPASSLREG